jgi:hypothetical protein
MTAAEVTDELHLQDKKSSVARCLSELKGEGKLGTTVNDEKRNVYHLTIKGCKTPALKFDAKPTEPLKPEFDYYVIDGCEDEYRTYETAIEAAKELTLNQSFTFDVYGVKQIKLATIEPVASVKVTEY